MITERQKTVEVVTLEYPPDPPLPEPYPGYSMLDLVEREKRGESSTHRPPLNQRNR